MTASEIAETLLNGNISGARNAILNANALTQVEQPAASALMALDVVEQLSYVSGEYTAEEAIQRIQHLLAS